MNLSKIWNKYKTNKLLKGSSAFFIIKIIALIFGYINVVIVTKYFGKSALGIFSYTVSALTIIGTFSGLGVEMTTLRFVSKYKAQKDFGKIKSFYFQVLKIIFLPGLILSLLFFFFPDFIAGKILGKPEYAHFIQIFSVLLIPTSIRRINNQFQRAYNKIGEYAFINFFYTPITVILLLFIIFLTPIRNEATPTNMHFISILLISILSVFFVLKLKNWKNATITQKVSFSDIFNVSIPMYSIAIAGAVTTWADKLILGYHVSNADIGIYHAMSRLAAIVNLILLTANSSLAPKFSELYELNKLDEMKILAYKSTKYTALVSLVVCIFILITGVPIINFLEMDIFPAFYVLLAMSLGELFSSWTGAVSTFLLMTGNEKINQKINIISTFAFIIFNIIFVGFWGILGAAIATSLIIFIKNLVFVIIVKNKYNILFFYLPRFISKSDS